MCALLGTAFLRWPLLTRGTWLLLLLRARLFLCRTIARLCLLLLLRLLRLLLLLGLWILLDATAIGALPLLVLLLGPALIATTLLLTFALLAIALRLGLPHWLRARNWSGCDRFGLRLRTKNAKDARDDALAALWTRNWRSDWLCRRHRWPNRRRDSRCDRLLLILEVAHRRGADRLNLGDGSNRNVEVCLRQGMRCELAWRPALVARAR